MMVTKSHPSLLKRRDHRAPWSSGTFAALCDRAPIARRGWDRMSAWGPCSLEDPQPKFWPTNVDNSYTFTH
jgi:hypothetical protein